MIRQFTFIAMALLLAAVAWSQTSATTPLGIYNSSAPTLSSGGFSPLQLDSSGNLKVNVASGSTGNAAAGNTGSAVPTQADYCGVNVGGTLRGCTGVNPSGTVYAIQTDITSVNGVTALTGNGTTGTGSQRVTIASDNTAFSVNATLSAETTKVIGTVNQGTSPWIVAGGGTAGTAATGVVTVQGIASMTKILVTPDSVALPANQSVNVAQINAVAPLMGNGVTGTGSQRVTIASDNTAFTVNAAESGIWTVQPGNTANTTAWLTRVPTSCGATFYESLMTYLPSASTQLTATATCVTYVSFENKDTANHTVSMQDQSTGCNSGVCATMTTFLIPPGGYVDRQMAGTKYVGGIKWSADAANVVVADVIGWQ